MAILNPTMKHHARWEGFTEVIIRFHEIALKGKNRPMFVRALVNNIRRATEGLGVKRVWDERMMIRCTLNQDADWNQIKERLSMVFGAVKFTLAKQVPHNYDAVVNSVKSLISNYDFQTFRISAKRAEKRFYLTSKELNIRVGNLVRELSGARVNLSKPELEIHIEVLPKGIFIYAEDFHGAGGLPVGTAGRVATLMSGGIDSPVAAWRAMRRGCQTSLLHFHSFPLVEGRSREKARDLAEMLNRYQYDTRLFLIPFADIQRQMLLSVPPIYRVVMYRRFMVRIAQEIAKSEGALALVTGESIGQVGSQTLQNIATIESAVDIPILRPLVGMDKQEITDQATKLDTYGISILPDEDCCTLFVPKSPSTRVSVEDVTRIESDLDVKGLVTKAVQESELIEYHQPSTGSV